MKQTIKSGIAIWRERGYFNGYTAAQPVLRAWAMKKFLDEALNHEGAG